MRPRTLDVPEHDNPRYEYCTRHVATSNTDMLARRIDGELEPLGWHRAWAEVTMEGTFLVFRREKV